MKPALVVKSEDDASSHPAGVRGLKPRSEYSRLNLFLSHPAGVRGLKHSRKMKLHRGEGVAPRRGAWIETPASLKRPPAPVRRTPQGCVD